MNFLGDDFWNYFSMQCSWFDSGYMCVSLRRLLWLVLLMFPHLALYFFPPVVRPMMLCTMAGIIQRG